jgi:hypothetical protein
MDIGNWITVGIALFTLINGWCQFWVKEGLFNKNTNQSEPLLVIFRSRIGLFIIAFTGILSGASIILLVLEVLSNQALTRFTCFTISGLTVLSVLNLLLVQSIFTLRRLASLSDEIKRAEGRAKTWMWLLG